MPIGQTAYPTALDTTSTLVEVADLAATALTVAMLVGDTSMTVTSTTPFPATGVLTVESEKIAYAGTTSTTFTGLTRAFDGSTAAAHAIGIPVNLNDLSLHHKAHSAALVAVETKLGIGASTPAAHQVLRTNATGTILAAWRAAETYNVLDYGAVGDGSHDDTAAFQAAATAAATDSGVLVIPNPGSQWVLTSTVTIAPPGANDSFYMDIVGMGRSGVISWQGGSNTTVFHTFGWKRSRIDRIHVALASNQDNVTVWDLDDDATRPSSNFLHFGGCSIALGGGRSCRGWRAGHNGLNGDVPLIVWDRCDVDGVQGTNATNGHIGWLNLSTNALLWKLDTCGCIDCTTMFRNSVLETSSVGSTAIGAATITVRSAVGFPTSGSLTIGAQTVTYAGTTATSFTGCAGITAGFGAGTVVLEAPGWDVMSGAGSHTFLNCSTTRTFCDFVIDTAGVYNVIGHRGEDGNRFVRAAVGSGYSLDLRVAGCTVGHYAPADNIVFALGTAVALNITASNFYAQDYTSAFITTGNFDGFGYAGPYGSITIADTFVRSPGVAALWSLSDPATWRARALGVQQGNSSNILTGLFAPNLGTEGEVDFGPTPTGPQRFVVTDAAVSATSHLLVSQSGSTPTGGFGDEAELDPIVFSAEALAGALQVNARPLDGHVLGKFRFVYQIV